MSDNKKVRAVINLCSGGNVTVTSNDKDIIDNVNKAVPGSKGDDHQRNFEDLSYEQKKKITTAAGKTAYNNYGGPVQTKFSSNGKFSTLLIIAGVAAAIVIGVLI